MSQMLLPVDPNWFDPQHQSHIHLPKGDWKIDWSAVQLICTPLASMAFHCQAMSLACLCRQADQEATFYRKKKLSVGAVKNLIHRK